MSRRSAAHEELGIGLLGCGVVGSAVARVIGRHATVIRARTGRVPVIRAVAVRHLGKERDVPIPRSLFTLDAWHVATRPDVDVVVEVIGGRDPADGLIEAALGAGKDVVTAGKELLASQFAKLEDLAAKAGSAFMYEAAVMAGTPAISTVKSLIGDRICRLQGVLNGTCNYCLQRMEEASLTLAQAAAEVRELGYAEPDPTADVEGYDAAAKLAILATIPFGQPVTYEDVTVTGITGVRSSDLADAAARQVGRRSSTGTRRRYGPSRACVPVGWPPPFSRPWALQRPLDRGKSGR
jgi:homoserine dehydrogenase